MTERSEITCNRCMKKGDKKITCLRLNYFIWGLEMYFGEDKDFDDVLVELAPLCDEYENMSIGEVS